jgi:uncharacterized protein (TIGR02145 family)
MNYKWLSGWMFILAFGCDATDRDILPPEASYKVSSTNALTTDTLFFDASPTASGSNKSRSYFRWDWNHDGIWDSEFSGIPLSAHRYYVPGSYNPVMEVINSDGLKDTVSVQIRVNRGYSHPHARFAVHPEYGNFTTRFYFDASASTDDEDSLQALRFRWDFADNGTFVPPFSSDPTANFVFNDTGHYITMLEVMDPQGMRNQYRKEIWVTNVNPEIIADFNWSPVYGTTDTIFVFNASATHFNGNQPATFKYSWKLPPLYAWTDWSLDPSIQFQFTREDDYEIELRVQDSARLVNYCKKTITVYHQNVPPLAKFLIGCRRGNIKTQFYFDSWLTLDKESLPTTLEVRWDFEGDGAWDTEFSKERRVYHSYPQPGTYRVVLEAIDPGGLSDTSAQTVEVSPYSNETGLIFDQRDGQYYGTVKIGNQWWMSQNLNFEPYDENKDVVRKHCYARDCADRFPWCNVLGGLYSVHHATREDFYGDVKGICPTGWHMPSRKEWEKLIGTIGGWDQVDKLLPGGETDFNALYAGRNEIVWCPQINEWIEGFKWLDYAGYFWSFNKMSDPNAPNAWSIAIIKGEKKFYPGWDGMNSWFSVRCVKNEN